MPSRWSLTFAVDDPAAVRPQQVAAMISGWIESDAEHRAPRKAYTVSPLRDVGARGQVAVDLGVLDDALVPRILAGARAVAAGGRWGGQRVRIVPGAGGEVAQLECAQDWAELAAAPTVGSRVRLALLSPVAFRHGQQYLPFPLPGLVFGHLREQWTLWGGAAAAPTEPSMDDCGLTVVDFDVQCQHIPLRHRTAPASVGEVTYGIGRDPQVRAAIGRWLAVLPYAALGAETRMGLGQAQVLPLPA